MGQKELILFSIFYFLVMALFMAGLVAFFMQYRQRKRMFERQMAHQELEHQKKLAESALAIQSLTMADIGRELHDNVGQQLTLASLYLHRSSAGNLPAAATLAETQNIVDDSIQNLRQISRMLVKANLEAVSLNTVLEKLCHKIHNMQLLQVVYTAAVPDVMLQAQRANMLERIAQEALQNSLRHAKATKIQVTLYHSHNKEADLQTQDGRATLQITDDGRGFEMDEEGLPGIGLENMRTRAHAIDAQCIINSKPGMGCTCTIHFSYA